MTSMKMLPIQRVQLITCDEWRPKNSIQIDPPVIPGPLIAFPGSIRAVACLA